MPKAETMIASGVVGNHMNAQPPGFCVENKADACVDSAGFAILGRKSPTLFDGASHGAAQQSSSAQKSRDEFLPADRRGVQIADVLSALPLEEIAQHAVTVVERYGAVLFDAQQHPAVGQGIGCYCDRPNFSASSGVRYAHWKYAEPIAGDVLNP
jgi:hypothetical protein